LHSDMKLYVNYAQYSVVIQNEASLYGGLLKLLENKGYWRLSPAYN